MYLFAHVSNFIKKFKSSFIQTTPRFLCLRILWLQEVRFREGADLILASPPLKTIFFWRIIRREKRKSFGLRTQTNAVFALVEK